MHPRVLKTFLTAARTGNVTRAGEEIGLAQSSVSDQIQTLETELGVALFTRSRSGLALTSAGEAFRPYAEEMLALADDARAAVAASAGRMKGPVTVGALETIASMKLTRFLSSFQTEHPDIGVRLKIADTGSLERKLIDGEIDVAFCFDRDGFDERLIRRRVAREPLVLVAPPGKEPLVGKSDLSALASRRFVATEVGCVYRRLFDAAFAEAGLPAPRPVAEAGSIRAIARLVADGVGLALVPRLAVAAALDDGEIVAVPWPGLVQAAALVMVWRRRRVQAPTLKRLLTAATAHFSSVRSADVPLPHAVSFPS